MKKALLKYWDKLYEKLWVVGHASGNLADMIREKKFDVSITWDPPTPGRFWADPFLYQHQDKTFTLLAEDFSYADGYGKISIRQYDAAYQALGEKVLIDTGTHLSYPFIYEEGGKSWVFPEAGESGRLTAYEADLKNGKVLQEKVVLDQPVVDPTVLFFEGRYWMFCTLRGDTVFSAMHIFFADHLLGPYTAHPQNPVKEAWNGSRPAGHFIKVDGEWYLPTQNCEHLYGESVTVLKITKLTPTEFASVHHMDIRLNEAGRKKGLIQLHTINQAGDRIVVDGGFRLFAPVRQFRNRIRKKAYEASLKAKTKA